VVVFASCVTVASRPLGASSSMVGFGSAEAVMIARAKRTSRTDLVGLEFLRPLGVSRVQEYGKRSSRFARMPSAWVWPSARCPASCWHEATV